MSTPVNNETKTVIVHRVLVTADGDSLFEINYSFLCPYCGKEHTQRETDGYDPLMDEVCYSLGCGHLRILMPWCKGRTALADR